MSVKLATQYIHIVQETLNRLVRHSASTMFPSPQPPLPLALTNPIPPDPLTHPSIPRSTIPRSTTTGGVSSRVLNPKIASIQKPKAQTFIPKPPPSLDFLLLRRRRRRRSPRAGPLPFEFHPSLPLPRTSSTSFASDSPSSSLVEGTPYGADPASLFLAVEVDLAGRRRGASGSQSRSRSRGVGRLQVIHTGEVRPELKRKLMKP